jgi:DNA-binding transcriptional regulator YiaG
MKCDICLNEMEERKATHQQPYRYVLSGLKNVYLMGIRVRVCPTCKIESPIIPRMADLHDVIRQILVRKPELLTGDEIRFLRKNAGLAAKQFAEFIDESPSHLSRVENGKTPALGAQADKLARAIANVCGNHEGTKEVLLQKIKNLKKSKVSSRMFQLKGNRWRSAA